MDRIKGQNVRPGNQWYYCHPILTFAFSLLTFSPLADLRHLLLKTFHPVLKPLVKLYLSSERNYRHKGINIKVFPGVFHPGLFFSTSILLEYLADKNLANKKFLELGAGTGLISTFASKKGALVTASDISEAAIRNIRKNAELNHLKIEVIKSDLFELIPVNYFDWIIINPPYYPRKVVKEEDHAWFCGENFEYFHKLYRLLPKYNNGNSTALMILSEDCDLAIINNIANNYGWQMSLTLEKKIYGEVNYIFKIQKNNI